MDQRGSRVLGIDPGRSDDALHQIVVEEGLDRARVGAGARQHDPMGRMPAVDREQLAGDRLEVPLLLLRGFDY